MLLKVDILPDVLSVEERNLLYGAHKIAVSSRRTVPRVIISVEQKEKAISPIITVISSRFVVVRRKQRQRGIMGSVKTVTKNNEGRETNQAKSTIAAMVPFEIRRQNPLRQIQASLAPGKNWPVI